jgi:hypothetical protein
VTKEAPEIPARPEHQSSPRFSERLSTPLWWYPIGLGIAAILAAEFRIADHTLTVWIPFGILLPGSLLIIWSMGRQKVEVDDQQLRIRDAHLPLAVIETVVPLDATTLRRLVGRYGDPASFISTRPWVGPGIQIILDDPEDPTPYWVISTRRPEALAAALRPRPEPSAL